MPNFNKFSYKDIKIGDVFSFEQLIDEKKVKKFADLTGDYNPLHLDADYAERTEFKERIVHGMLIAGFFSTLVGMLCPGEKALYISQSLNFRNPLSLNKNVIIEGRVINKIDAFKILELRTEIKDEEERIIIDGIARVKVRD